MWFDDGGHVLMSRVFFLSVGWILVELGWRTFPVCMSLGYLHIAGFVLLGLLLFLIVRGKQ